MTRLPPRDECPVRRLLAWPAVSAHYHCLIYGLVVASEVDLLLPQVHPQPADVTYRLALGTTLPASSHSRSDDPDHPWAVEHWMGRRLAVEFPGRATFELSRTDVALVSDTTRDTDLVIHLLLDHVLPRVVALRGDLMLHASGAVGPSGRAHLFLGQTGAGKSTIATALVADGWSLLDDDCIRVIPTALGFHALPGAPSVRLLPDAAAALIPEVEPGRPISAGNAKRRFTADGQRLRMATNPALIAGLYLPAGVELIEPSVERLGFAEALGSIVEHGFHLADEPAAVARRAFEGASALAAAAPVWRLTLPAGLGEIAATTSLIAELDSSR